MKSPVAQLFISVYSEQYNDISKYIRRLAVTVSDRIQFMMAYLTLALLLLISSQHISSNITREAFTRIVTGDCSDVYAQDSDNCADGCGSCFNGEGRSSTPDFDVVMCPSDNSSPGYYCDPEGGVFACMDWTFGSNKLKEQEQKFNSRTYRFVIIYSFVVAPFLGDRMFGLALEHLVLLLMPCKAWELATDWW